MIALLAQVESTQPLQLPVSYGGIAAIVFGGVVVFALVALWMLREFQAGRAALVAEVKKELATPTEPQPMTLPQPFTVTPHVEFTPVADHERLEQDFKDFLAKTDERFNAMSRASSQSREKIFDLIREQMSATRTEFKNDISALTSRISDTLIALGRAEGELRAKRAKDS